MNSAGQSRAPASSWACLHGAQRVALPRPKFRSLHRRQRAAVVRAAAAAPVPLAPDAVAAEADATPAALQWFKRMQMEAAIPFSSAVEEVDVSGSARHAGVEMQWKLSCDSHGSFVECLTSPQMSCSWGYAAAATDNSSSSLEPTGNSDSSTPAASSSQQPLARLSGGASHTSSRYFATDGVCWAADDAGCPQLLQLDDEEALLLSTYVRTGMWVLPSIAQLLEVTAVAPPSTAAAAAFVAALAGQAAHPCPSGSSDSSPSSSRGPSSSSSSSSSSPSSSGGPSSSSSSSSSSESGTAWVRLRMRGGGRVAALLELCSDSWRPLSMRLQMAGSDELWQLSGWREWQQGLWLATTAVQSNCSEGGVVNTFTADSVQLRSSSTGDRTPRSGTGIIPSDSSSSSDGSSSSRSNSRFSPPLAPLLPADSSFLAGVPEEVPAWHTSSGHTLVRPLINGREVGYFIFDTGASGFVLDPAVAAELGLEGFGELQVTSMVGKVASRFRRAATFQLGPLLLQRPLLMELPCSGLVTGLPEGARLAGIVGHDVLRRAVVHMPPHPSRPPASTAATRDVDSPAAAVAAAVAAARARKTPLQLTLRLQHPGQPAVTAAASAAAGSGTGAAAQAVSSACAAAAAGTAAVMSGVGGPAFEATTASQLESSSKHASSSSNSTTSSTSTSSDASMRKAAAKLPSSPPPPQQRPQPQPQWLQLVMVEGLPHIELELVSEGQRRHTGLFMIDSGAGGFDLILNSRAAHSLGLCPRASKEGNRSAGGSGSTTVIQGIGGGSTNRLAAQRRQLAEVRLGPAAFRAVTALVYGGSGSGGGGLSLSQHTSGIVCGGLLGRCSLVFDYPRMRMAVMCDAAASPKLCLDDSASKTHTAVA